MTNNFSPTHQARESRPSVFHSITPPAPPSAPFFLLYTNKPITAMDINWTPFLKMLPQPFFCPSLLSCNQPAHHVNYMHTHAHTYTQACMHMRNLCHSRHKLAVLCSNLVLAALCLLNLLSCGIQIENGFSFISLPPFFLHCSQPQTFLSLHHTFGYLPNFCMVP